MLYASSYEASRARLVDRLVCIVADLELDLRGATVLTEAATGPYVVTPVIAALAGANVYAYTRATRYGTFDDVVSQTESLLADPRLCHLHVNYLRDLTPDVIGSADVITNSGHLRPLDAAKMKYAKSSTVVPLMYEAWEFRTADVDLAYLKSRRIAVGATNERHPFIDVFGFLGEMAVKQIHDSGLSLHADQFVLITNNDFGPYLARTLADLCAGLAVIDLDEHRDRYSGLKVDWLGGFPHIEIPETYRRASADLLAAYPFDKTWIGPEAPIPAEAIVKQFSRPVLLRYSGDVDVDAITSAGVTAVPAEVPSGHMGVLPSALGPEPIIRLQAGGLRAAQALMSGVHQYRGVPVVEVM